MLAWKIRQPKVVAPLVLMLHIYSLLFSESVCIFLDPADLVTCLCFQCPWASVFNAPLYVFICYL